MLSAGARAEGCRVIYVGGLHIALPCTPLTPTSSVALSPDAALMRVYIIVAPSFVSLFTTQASMVCMRERDGPSPD